MAIIGRHGRVRRWIGALFFLLACSALHAQQQGTVTYVYTDPQGTPLAEADAHGNITATYDYTPYGTTALGTPAAGPGYTGHVNDPETNLVYMQARYYDPAIGHFLSADPLEPTAGNTFNFNRYAYVNNNPVNHIDPNGKCLEDGCIGEAAIACAATPACSRAVMAAGATTIAFFTVRAVHNTATTTTQNNNSDVPAPTPAPTTAPTTDGNTNPYAGPVDSPVVVVDKNGNAIPVDAGNSIGASPSGDYQEVKDRTGNATGDRLDRGGHRTQSDPKAQQPHAHRPGVTDPDGNPHLPINPPTPSPSPPSPPPTPAPSSGA
jgi:RHS repeat-associated protein